MTVYEKSNPTVAVKPTKSARPIDTDIRKLEKRISDQDKLLQELAKEIRRLKSKLDAHAAVINSNRG
jgi:hypothetical protein